MFPKSALLTSLFGLAMGGPIARRQFPTVVDSNAIFSSSSSTQINNGGFFSFDGLSGSLKGFDSFYGQSNFCGVNNVLVVEKVETCVTTEIVVIQQRLAVLAEFAKKVILTQTCDTETQVAVFSQWLGNLMNFNQDLRHVQGHRAPSYDHNIASQIGSLVDVSGQIITTPFPWSGASIGSHSVTISNSVFVSQSVETVWDTCVQAASPTVVLECPVSSSHCPSSHETVIQEHHTSTQAYYPPQHTQPAYYPPQHSQPAYYPQPPYYPPSYGNSYPSHDNKVTTVIQEIPVYVPSEHTVIVEGHQSQVYNYETPSQYGNYNYNYNTVGNQHTSTIQYVPPAHTSTVTHSTSAPIEAKLPAPTGGISVDTSVEGTDVVTESTETDSSTESTSTETSSSSSTTTTTEASASTSSSTSVPAASVSARARRSLLPRRQRAFGRA